MLVAVERSQTGPIRCQRWKAQANERIGVANKPIRVQAVCGRTVGLVGLSLLLALCGAGKGHRGARGSVLHGNKEALCRDLGRAAAPGMHTSLSLFPNWDGCPFAQGEQLLLCQAEVQATSLRGHR